MKIGILTLPLHENYGGILQALALYRFLHNQGHDIVLIYKDKHQPFWKKLIRKILLKIPFHNFKNIKTKYKLYQEWQNGKKYHRQFVENEIFKISLDLFTTKELENYVKNEKFDAVIVGSDQVWRKEYINDKYYRSYFLDFVDGKKLKKIAYAASFGQSYWEGENDIEEISRLFQDFAAISVREFSGIDICKNTFAYDKAVHVIDPTMLMSKDFYINEIISEYDISRVHNGGLITYVLDEESEKKDIINLIAENLLIINVNHLKGFSDSKIIYSIPEWLYSFANADFIVTDSFHGMVFSIIFEKNFIVIGNRNRGMERFTSLLNLFGLESRLLLDKSELNNKKLEKIDFAKVNDILNKKRDLSKIFLKNALKK